MPGKEEINDSISFLFQRQFYCDFPALCRQIRLQIANVGSLDCRDLTKLPRRRRYDRIRDNEGKGSVDNCTTILLSVSHIHPFPFSLSVSLCLSSSLHSVLRSRSLFSNILYCRLCRTYFSIIHPPSFLLRAFPCELQVPRFLFFDFSHFNATSVRLRDDIYYTPRPYDNTVDNGNDGCTSLFMPPLPPTNPRAAFACLPFRCRPAELSCRFLSRFPSFVLSRCQKNVGSNAL